MMMRALVLVLLLAPGILAGLSLLIVPGLLTTIVIALALFYRSKRAPDEAEPRALKPPGIALALLFAATVAAMTTAAGWAAQQFGAGSAAGVIAVGGLADIDSAIAAIGTLPAGTIAPRLAVYAIAAPVLFNTLFKLSIVISVAGVRRAVWGCFSLIVSAAVLAGMGLATAL
jgi:uncharacterized membrane protein (DUF4010 family)